MVLLLALSHRRTLLKDTVVDAVAGLGPLGTGNLPDYAAVIPVAVPVLRAAGAPVVQENHVSALCQDVVQGEQLTRPTSAGDGWQR